MPVVSGIDLQGAAGRVRDIPIVFLSGHAEFQSGVRAMKAGAVDFLAKPFTEAELLAAVAKALEKDRGARAARVLKQDALERLAGATPGAPGLRSGRDQLLNKQSRARRGRRRSSATEAV